MFRKIKRFMKSEKGYTVESLVWTSILGLGAATVAMGIYAADRYQSGGVVDDMKAIQTPSLLPTATESVAELQAGYTGAIIGMTVTQGE